MTQRDPSPICTPTRSEQQTVLLFNIATWMRWRHFDGRDDSVTTRITRCDSKVRSADTANEDVLACDSADLAGIGL